MILLLLIFPALADEECVLLGQGRSAEKPNPSLVKCYRQNASACCVSGHDQYIHDAYEDFMSEQCQREYTTMEDYFCFGCMPETSEYIDVVNKEIRMCKSYLEEVWGNDLEKRSTEYDNCGINTYWRGDNATYVLPSVEWENGRQFFEELKIPLFEDYKIVMVDSSDSDKCYNNGYLLILNILILLTLL